MGHNLASGFLTENLSLEGRPVEDRITLLLVGILLLPANYLPGTLHVLMVRNLLDGAINPS